VEYTTLDITEVIEGMMPLLRRSIGEHYELVTDFEANVCCVSANTSQMEQVLMNLVVNARDAMPGGGRILIETATVTLDEEYVGTHVGVEPGEYVMYAVSDTGEGMSEEVRSRIFEPFYTTKEVGKGTGLGLATCSGIVKQSKGNIWVESEPGKGTIFKVYLPRAYNDVSEKTIQTLESLPVGTETILLVDDEPMVRDIATQTLEAQGYRVIAASNGAEALHLQSQWEGEIDLLLTDVVMPLMSGKELAQRLTELRPKTRVLYMSGYTQNVVVQEGILKPGVLLLTKPFTSALLCNKVKEALNAEEPGALE
jgi:two-component system, cell cycle sensor histidine kinase and response regulator CckA